MDRGGGRGRGGRGRGRGRGGPRFQPFAGAGNVLGSDDNASTRGSAYYRQGFGNGHGNASRDGGFDLARHLADQSLNDTFNLSSSPSSSSRTSPFQSPKPGFRIPAGPKAGYNPSPRNFSGRGRYVPAPDAPASHSKTTYNRPLEETGDAKYLAAIGRGGKSKSKYGNFRSGDPAERRAMFAPVDFVKATGEWKDGKWTGKPTAADGQEAEHDAMTAPEGTQERFDALKTRPAGAGLGFAKSAAHASHQNEAFDSTSADTTDIEQPTDFSTQAEGDAELAALLQAYPEARTMDDTEDSFIAQTHLMPQPAFFSIPAFPTSSSPAPEPITSSAQAVIDKAPSQVATTRAADLARQSPFPKSAPALDSESSSDDGGEQILISNQYSKPDAADVLLAAQSDSEEERQLDAIIKAATTSVPDASEPAQAVEDGEAAPGDPFVIDFTGDDDPHPPESSEVPVTASSSFALGDRSFAAAAAPMADPFQKPVPPVESPFAKVIADSSDEDDFVPLKGKQVSTMPIGGGRKKRQAAKKARRKARKSGDLFFERQSAEPEDAPEPRVGDSDIEWGSDGPPTMSYKKKASNDEFIDPTEFQLRELSLSGQTYAPRTGQDERAMLDRALALSAAEAGPQHSSTDSGAGNGNISFSSISIKANRKGKKNRRNAEQEAVLADYLENVMRREGTVPDSDEDDDGPVFDGKLSDLRSDDLLDDGKVKKEDRPSTKKESEMDAMIRFMQGMDPQQGGRQLTIDDIEEETRMMEEDEWMTESEGSDVGEEEDDEGQDTAAEAAMAAAERDEIGASSAGSEQYDSDEDDEDDSEVIEQGDSDEDDSDDDDRVFDKNFTWAAEDEEFIQRIERFAQGNHDTLTGSDRKARNRLYKAIETGDFDDMADLVSEEDLAGTAPAKKTRGKKGEKKWQDSDLWAATLNEQWNKDRETKAANKRKRAEERRAAALNPFPQTIKKGTKKMAKKAARQARRASHREDIDAAEWDEPMPREPTGDILQANNLAELDGQIRIFLKFKDRTTMALPPMDKRSRAQVHMLANAYGLGSKSRGNGNHRFTTLIKSKYSGMNVDQRKVKSILSGRGGDSFGSGVKGKGKKLLSKKGGGGAVIHVPKNQDGSAVGWDAEKIGAENIGHKLLSMMGWAEGAGLGAAKEGMAEPVGATIKTSKGGLGF